VTFDAVTGAELSRNLPAGAATHTATVLYGLHEAHFAAPALRILFFLCGAMGAAAVASGLILWTVARAPKGAAPAGFGLRLVRVLNIGTIAGLPAGIGAFFLGNRLLPVTLEGRASWEVAAFFGAWLLVAVVGALAPRRWAWPTALGLAACPFLAVVPADLILVGEPRFVPFDLAMLALATLLILAARTAMRPPAALARRLPAGAIEA
jgi:uncharacterized iron-regulated membrane protein